MKSCAHFCKNEVKVPAASFPLDKIRQGSFLSLFLVMMGAVWTFLAIGAESKSEMSNVQWVEVTVDTVVRKRPRAKSEIIADLDRGTLLQFVRRSQNGQWLLVKDEESHSGWIPIKSTNLGSRPRPETLSRRDLPGELQKKPDDASLDGISPAPNGEMDLATSEPEDTDDDLKLVQDSHAIGLVWRGTLSARYTHRKNLEYPLSLGMGLSKQRWSIKDRRLAESSSWLGAVYKQDWNSAWGIALMGLYRDASSSWESGVDLGFMDKDSKWRWDFGYSSLYRPAGRPIYWIGRLSLLSGPWEWGASLGLGVAL